MYRKNILPEFLILFLALFLTGVGCGESIKTAGGGITPPPPPPPPPGTPYITSVQGTISHNATVSLSGTDFGTKSPAEPLFWDTGEGATLGSNQYLTTGDLPHIVSYLGSGLRAYHDTWPKDLTEEPTYEMMYRSAGYRSVPAPHSRSSVYLAGHHDDEGECLGGEVGQNVALNVSDGIVHDDWYVAFYLRLDPLWPAWRSANNYKEFNWEATSPFRIYDSISNYDNQNSCGGGHNNLRRAPQCLDTWVTGNIVRVIDDATCGDTANYPVITHDTNVKNELLQWVHVERRMDYTGDLYKVFHDNVAVVDTDLDPEGNCQVVSPSGPTPFGGVTLGGFWKEADCGGTQDDLNPNAVRYFDDVYVDTTLARVMLANNSNYDNATITEPQIPSAWSSTSITVKVNLGKLPSSGTAYLFVFNGSDGHNPIGYPVSLN